VRQKRVSGCLEASQQGGRDVCRVCLGWDPWRVRSGQNNSFSRHSLALALPDGPLGVWVIASAWRMQSRAHDDDGPMAGSPFRNEAAATDDGWWIKIAQRCSVARTLLGPMTVRGSDRAGLTVFRTRGSATKARYELHATGHP